VADTDVRWGGILASLALDPIEWRLSAEVEVTSGNASRRYTVVLDEVRELRGQADAAPRARTGTGAARA
jgi:hypothetical protein